MSTERLESELAGIMTRVMNIEDVAEELKETIGRKSKVFRVIDNETATMRREMDDLQQQVGELVALIKQIVIPAIEELSTETGAR